MRHLTLKKELNRKIIHLSSIWIPLTYLFMDFTQMLYLLSASTFLMITLDLLRVNNKLAAQLIKRCLNTLRFHEIFRPHEEKEGLSGASYMLLASMLCLLIFPREVFIAATLVLIISDTIAAFCGLLLGTCTIYKNKTLEGAAGFLFSSISVSLIVCMAYHLPLTPGIIASIISTITEVFSRGISIDDNFSIPLAYATSFMLVHNLLF